MSSNDENPVPAPALEAVQLVFVLEDRSIVLELLDLLRPIDEYVFVEAFEGKVDWLVERALIELAWWAHIEHDGYIFVIIHVANLLCCSHANLKWRLHLQECLQVRQYFLFLNAGNLSFDTEASRAHASWGCSLDHQSLQALLIFVYLSSLIVFIALRSRKLCRLWTNFINQSN